MKSFDNLAALLQLRDKLHKWKTIAVILVIVLVLLSLRLISGGKLSGDFIGGDYIAKINIEGVIFENDYRSEILKEVAQSDEIKAVIVNINSPGGGIVGSEVLFEELREISSKKPLVVVMGSVAASGGYMAAIASDHIIAHNGTLTGSIGVLMESPEITGLADKIGVKFNTYKSSPLKGSPSPFEKRNSYVDSVIQESIADSYQFFTDLVRERRGKKITKESAVFDGRVFTGRQALKAGLIDEIGGLKQALIYLESKKIDVENLPLSEVEVIEEEHDFLGKIFGFLPFFEGAKAFDFSKQIMAVMPR